MDWSNLVFMISPTRIAVLGIALLATVILGILGAIKSKQFKWAQIASCLTPSLNFFWMTIGYIAVAVIAALVDEGWSPGVVTAYTIISGTMVIKIKEQINYLTGGIIPIVNWKLPLESGSG